MKLSANGRALIKRLERLSLVAYPDAGQWSIGYGHAGAVEGQTITAAEANRLFDQDVLKYEAAVNGSALPATQQQFDAMVSLAWNIGVAGFQGSTVARLQRAGDYPGAADAFAMWKNSEGAVNPVLVGRRQVERNLYLYGVALPGNFTPEGPPALVLAAAVALLAYFALPKVPAARRLLAA